MTVRSAILDTNAALRLLNSEDSRLPTGGKRFAAA